MNPKISIAALALSLFALSVSAQVHVDINVGGPPVIVAPPPPVYVAPPRPVYVAPPPVYVAPPPPVYVAPGPAVVVVPGWYGNRYYDGRRYWSRHDWEARQRYYYGGHGYYHCPPGHAKKGEC